MRSRASLRRPLWRRLGAFVAAMFIMATGAEACAICFNGFAVTLGQQLDAADQAVLALPVTDGSPLRVVETVKGNTTVGAIIAEPVSRMEPASLRSGQPLLVLRNELGQRWTSIGAIGIEYAGWLRQLAATSRSTRGGPKLAWPRALQASFDLTDAERRERLALVVLYLEDPEPLAAEIAYGEISRAQYGAMRSLRARLDATKLARWIDDPNLAARRATYTLLLGIAGGPEDAVRLERRIDAAWRSHDAANLAAMLAADLELRGPSRVGYVEQRYLGDRDRTLPEIEAALLALGVHGSADAAIPRKRVIAAYQFFMRERKPMAGFVAQELADWGYWDATLDYAALLKSDVLKDPASHFAVVSYLQRSPRADAKAALRSLADQHR